MSPPTALPLPVVNPDQVEEDSKIVGIEFYKINPTKLFVYYILSFLTLGLIPLLCLWKYSWRVFFKYSETSPGDCQYILASNIDGIVQHIKVETKEFYFNDVRQNRKSFMFRHYTYYFDDNEGMYKPCEFSIQDKTYKVIHKEIGAGMPSLATVRNRLITYGLNSTDIPMKPNWKILLEEIHSPYYYFQIYTIVFWGYLIDYPIYVGISVSAAILLLVAHCYKTKMNLTRICEQAKYYTDVRVYRPSNDDEEIHSQVPQVINSNFLAPGDLVEIPNGKKLPCDIILLSGTAVMNESMLTGESALVNKTPLPKSDKKFDFRTSSQHILFSGTECVETIKTQTEPQIVGVVIRTGFLTMKGRLIRSFLYSKKEKSHFYHDTMKYMGIMGIIGFVNLMVILNTFITQEEKKFGPILGRCVELITIVVPPILPTFISLGLLISTLRLKFENIFTSSELKINYAGKVQMVCFSRTGTLTNDSLDFHGVKPIHMRHNRVPKFQPIIRNDIHANLSSTNTKGHNHLLLEVMATCHSLNYTEEVLSGEILDIKTLEATGWHIDNNDKRGARINAVRPPSSFKDEESYYSQSSELSIIKRFPYSQKLQRMTVISKDSKEQQQRMNIKGVPEVIKTLCRSRTVPKDFDDILDYYNKNGFKVIACATKLLDDSVKASDNLAREFFEKDMEFLGFLIFENKIRESAPLVMAELSKADIPTTMLTGDSLLAAVHTARQCGLIEKGQKVALATLGPRKDDMPLTRVKWCWMTGPSKEEPNREIFEKQEAAHEDNVILEFEETEHNGSLKDLDTADMINFLETLKSDNRAVIALTGDAFWYLEEQLETNSELYQSLLKKMKVFARVTADDKAVVIRQLQKQGNTVAMVGNGVSDCQALQTADVSIAITDSEATLVSSFMCKVPNLLCVTRILREGRAALVTGFQVIKYMSLYCLIQVFNVVAVTYHSSQFGQPSFLYQDIFVIIPTAFSLLFTKATETLSKKRPVEKLMSVPALFSVLGQAIIQCVACVVTVVILHRQPWYQTPTAIREARGVRYEDYTPDYDSTTLSLIGQIEYLTLVIAFSIGRPMRMPFYRNYLFMIVYLVTGVMSILLIVVKIPNLIDLLDIMAYDEEPKFRGVLFGITMINSGATLIYEWVVVDRLVPLVEKARSKNRFRVKGQY